MYIKFKKKALTQFPKNQTLRDMNILIQATSFSILLTLWLRRAIYFLLTCVTIQIQEIT